MSNLSATKQKIIDDIKNYGWHVIKVLEDNSGPGFVYSIGFFETFNHPEIIIIGLNLDLSHNIINDIGDDIKRGTMFNPDKFYPNLIEGFECYFTQVDKGFYEEYVGQAQWYYEEKQFPLLQCIYPTTKGIYPWAPNWSENIKLLQPILGRIKY